ncbi:MAG: Bax inhibitor-1 family protein [Planctomycetia bacterium]|nr:Bax inhibitor-1 family protein [Planctomycetia bacterium]
MQNQENKNGYDDSMNNYGYSQSASYLDDRMAAELEAADRATFIVKTYTHLLGAILAFVGLEVLIFHTLDVASLTQTFMGGRYSWLIVLVAFMGVSWIADIWASSTTSVFVQYLGLGVYVLAEAVIFVPLLYIATTYSSPEVLPTAAWTTLLLFGALSLVVFLTRYDFSFMRSFLFFAGFVALGLIVVAILFNFELGPVFTYAMIAFACCYILYDTSNVLHHYRVNQHVAASLALFASVALLFWYILRLFMSRE